MENNNSNLKNLREEFKQNINFSDENIWNSQEILIQDIAKEFLDILANKFNISEDNLINQFLGISIENLSKLLININ